jgi:outer membrane protein assembly factor BamB
VDELKERQDLLWAAGHGKNLLAINNAAQVVATLPLPAAVSAEILVKESLVYVACLDGTLMAVEKKENVNKAPMTTAAELSVLWRHSCKSPIFATPTVVKATDSPSELVVVVVTASGAVMAVDAENGNELWHRVIDPGGYYIPAVYFENSGSILLGSHSGQLTWIGVADGSIKGSYLVEGGGITGMVVLPSNICYGAKESVVFYVIISTVDGQILVLNCSSKEESRDVTSVNVAGRFQLPAASFSGFSYGVIGGMKVIYVGCRDDHLYCLVLP